MSKEILEALDKEIIRLMTELETLDPKSKEYDDVAGVLEGLHKLRDRELAAGNSERELELKERKLEFDEIKDTDDTLYKTNELAEHKKDRYIRYVLDGIGIVLPPIVYAVWMNKGFKFEETGTYTSQTFKNFFSKMNPFKK